MSVQGGTTTTTTPNRIRSGARTGRWVASHPTASGKQYQGGAEHSASACARSNSSGDHEVSGGLDVVGDADEGLFGSCGPVPTQRSWASSGPLVRSGELRRGGGECAPSLGDEEPAATGWSSWRRRLREPEPWLGGGRRCASTSPEASPAAPAPRTWQRASPPPRGELGGWQPGASASRRRLRAATGTLGHGRPCTRRLRRRPGRGPRSAGRTGDRRTTVAGLQGRRRTTRGPP